MKKISAVVITKNEEINISKCLFSLSFCDEIIVVDDFSSDKTVEVAKKYTDKIFLKKIEHSFSEQRNFALSKVVNEWALFLDADEIISNELKDEIIKAVENDRHIAFRIQREDVLFGKRLKNGDVGNAFFVRLGKRSAGKWKGAVHETWDIKGNIGKLQHPIIHTPHQTISEFISEIDLYSTLRAHELLGFKKRVGVLQIILYPKLKFLKLYILQGGFFDGIEGFIHALLMSMYSFLVRGKLFLLQNK